MATITKPIILDETGQRMATALETIAQNANAQMGTIIDGTELPFDPNGKVTIPIATSSQYGVIKKPTIKSTLDSVLVPNTEYYLGTQTLVSLTLPSTGSNGDIITVDFASGSTATTLTISGSVAGDTSFAPSANTLVEMSFKRSGTYWKMLTSEVTA